MAGGDTMTTVTVAEAREKLPELLRRVAAGEQIVITEDGKWLAALATPPKPPPTPKEIATAQARAEAAIIEMLRYQIACGTVFPPESKIWELLAEDDARRKAGIETLIQQIAQWHKEDGLPYPPEDETATIVRREQIIREWLRLRADAPIPKPDEMTCEEYLSMYQEQE
jgi:antitoxin (DNA-binding transcriptional repressor) of toxin-antitoxin stability system